MPIPVLVGVPPAKNSITYRGLDINNPAEDDKDCYIVEDVSESDAWQQAIEPLPDRDGSQTLEPFAMQKLLRIRGWVRGSTYGKLFDRIANINAAFHPVLSYNADTSTFNKGYLPITFDVPTDDTTNYVTGLIPCQYYVAAIRLPVQFTGKFNGYSARMDFMVRAADPRRYLQTASTATRSGAGTVSCDNTLASYPSYPIITIAVGATSPGGGTITITRTSPTATGSVSLDGDVLAINTTYILDMQARTLYTAGGVDKTAALVAGAVFFDIRDAVSNTVDFAVDFAGVDFTVDWVRAFV